MYPIRASHKLDIFADELSFRVVRSREIVSEFDITVVEGSEQQLAVAYAPLIRKLKDQDPEVRSLAISAIVQNPTRSLEEPILGLADDPQEMAAAISGLGRLATPRAKAKLAELSSEGKPEGIRQKAITTLGSLGDPAYCALMLDIAQQSNEYSRLIALRAAGYLCGPGALSLSRILLTTTDHSTRFEAAYALGNSRNRQAVPLLITLLIDPNPEVRRAARDSLCSLTHRCSSGDDGQGKASYNQWRQWWAVHSSDAPIYSVDECPAPD